MYQGMITNNPLINNFNTYNMANPSQIPFQSNQLLNENIHVMNSLNDMVQQQRFGQQAMNTYSQLNSKDPYQERDKSNVGNLNSNLNSNPNPNSKSSKNKNLNIIEEMMKPQKILKENKDVNPNFRAIQKEYEESQTKEGIQQKFKITNVPYKSIIRDKIITKDVYEIKAEDLIVHKTTNVDRDSDIFNTEFDIKNIELDKINEEIKIDFHIDNYDKHKKKYDFKETFIKNLAFEANTCDENKQDYIEFYRKKQKEAEVGKEICDSVLHKLLDTGLIKPEELPSDFQDDDLIVAEQTHSEKQPNSEQQLQSENLMRAENIPKKSKSNISIKSKSSLKSSTALSHMRQTKQTKQSLSTKIIEI